MSLFVAQLINGLQLGLLLFLLAAGLSLTLGVMDFVNLSHGAFYMLGALMVASFTALSGSFLLAIPFALLGVFGVAAITERLLIRRLYARDHLEQVLVAYGLILVFDSLAHMLWGSAGAAVELPAFLNGRVEIGGLGGVVLPVYRLVIIACGGLLALGLYLLVNRTRLGALIRAGASNRKMVANLGVNIDRLYWLVFALGATMAGFAGLLIAPITEASIGMGGEIIIIAFVVVIVGGTGSVQGALYAALLIGFLDTLGRAYLDDLLKLFFAPQTAETAAPALSAMLVYVIMASILAISPQGLISQHRPRG